MDFIIAFFRDVLDGPLYIGIAITCGILICSCIGYLGEQYLNKQKEKKEYEATHAAIAGEVVDASTLAGATVAQPEGVTSLEQAVVAPVAEVADSIQTAVSPGGPQGQ